MDGGVTGVASHTVAAGDAEARLDRWFKRHYPGLPYGRLAKLLRTGRIRVDGRRARPNQRLEPGQVVRVPPLPPDADAEAPPSGPVSEAEREAFAARVLYRDESVIAVNKPHGLPSQGGTRVPRSVDDLAHALCPDDAQRPRLVHRLDKDTSGVLLLARTANAATALGRAMREGWARKVYWAVTAGRPPHREGRVDVRLSKHKRGGGEKMGPDPKGKRAVTHYRELAATPSGLAWLALVPRTGRTHQLRVHASHLDAPILADGKYGGPAAYPEDVLPDKLHLHARELALPHPDDGTTLRLAAPLPDHMTETFAALGFDAAAGDGELPRDVDDADACTISS